MQNLAEFWNVSTRPVDKNGFGLSIEVVQRRLHIIDRFVEVATETAASYSVWKRMLSQLRVQGVKVHDARLVSVMIADGVRSILTLNEKDFERYTGEGIQIETPSMFACS